MFHKASISTFWVVLYSGWFDKEFYSPVNTVNLCPDSQSTYTHFSWVGLVLLAVNQYFVHILWQVTDNCLSWKSAEEEWWWQKLFLDQSLWKLCSHLRKLQRLFPFKELGPVVQSIVSLTSLLVIKMLTVLASTISNFTGIFAAKMWVAFVNANATHIFSVKILAYMPYLMIKILTIH